MAKKPTLTHLDASIKRWRTRARRAMTTLGKLERQRERLLSRIEKPVGTVFTAKSANNAADQLAGFHPSQSDAERTKRGASTAPDWKATAESAKAASDKVIADAHVEPADLQKVYKATDIDTTIPEFLRRGMAAKSAVDQVIAEQMVAEKADTKKKKAAGRIAKMKAKKSGETRKMPLTGKAALEAIRNG